MSLQDCADQVAAGDPDRFAAAMAAPVAARRVLFPVQAFALEIARAPWVTQEPLIAEMRLQFWRDVLDAIAAGEAVQPHAVATARAEVIGPSPAALLRPAVEARRADIAAETVASASALMDYLDATAAAPIWAAATALGAPPAAEDPTRAIGRAAGLARYLVAVPALVAAGRTPLPDMGEAAIAALARSALAAMPGGRFLPMPARAATFEAFLARPLLSRAAARPYRVREGDLAVSPFRRRVRLLRLR